MGPLSVCMSVLSVQRVKKASQAARAGGWTKDGPPLGSFLRLFARKDEDLDGGGGGSGDGYDDGKSLSQSAGRPGQRKKEKRGFRGKRLSD